MTHTSKGLGSSAFAFLAGVGAGAAAGLLLAPRSGQDTRHKLKEKAAEARTRVQEEAAQQKDAMQDKAGQAVAKAADMTGRKLETGREAAEDMQHKTRRAGTKFAGES